MIMGVVNKGATALLCGTELGAIAATMKLGKKGKRWPIIIGILTAWETGSWLWSRHSLKKQLEEQGYELVKYSYIDHLKTMGDGELPEELYTRKEDEEA
jgi:hypothetical protein